MLSEPNISYKPFWGICRPLNSWRANSPNPIQIYCALFFVYKKAQILFDLNPLYYSIGQSQTIEVVSTSISVTTNGNCVWSTSIPYKINDNVCPLGIV